MLEIEIDGKKTEVADGSTVMDAAHQLGTYIPHFCYHKKLSIAANCRMCLVEVEKAPKPIPACATPVTNGMKVSTHSEKTVKAQKAVMEFLLINHPLDCPICDQGGECQLQDLAVGYGASGSRYQEEKRVVVNKNLGPLINTDMTRCIHCTRCVRFGQEIAGIMELGMANRGEHSEIMTFVDRSVDSELSGNSIDLCPVGALTSKPFRFSARSWEMARRRAVSPHDSLGANLVVQVQHDRVKRVLPLDNEDINECWLADRDRFSYEALSSEDRLTRPMVKQGGNWIETDWETALAYVVKGLKGVIADHGTDAVGALLSPHATVEELYLAQQLVRALGSDNVDFRLRQGDFSGDAGRAGIPWLGLPVAKLSTLDRVLVVGSFLRKDHPLIAQRLRQAARKGAQVSLFGASVEDPLMPVAHRMAVAPDAQVAALAAIAVEAATLKGATLPAQIASLASASSEPARAIAASLASGEAGGAILLGNSVMQHPAGATLWAVAQALAEVLGLPFGFLGEAANSVGGYAAKAMPVRGLNAAAMLAAPRKAYLLLGVEPALDCADGAAAVKALAEAETVIAFTAFRSAVADVADVMLPIAPFTETSGTFINTEGRIQSFRAVVKPAGQTRPAWKVLRVLGNLLELPGFGYASSEAVRDAALAGGELPLSNRLNLVTPSARMPIAGLQRVADVPIYATDPLVRRAPALQRTRDARPPKLRLAGETLTQLGVSPGATVRVRANGAAVELVAERDDALAPGCARIAVAHPATLALGPMFGEIAVEPV